MLSKRISDALANRSDIWFSCLTCDGMEANLEDSTNPPNAAWKVSTAPIATDDWMFTKCHLDCQSRRQAQIWKLLPHSPSAQASLLTLLTNHTGKDSMLTQELLSIHHAYLAVPLLPFFHTRKVKIGDIMRVLCRKKREDGTSSVGFVLVSAVPTTFRVCQSISSLWQL